MADNITYLEEEVIAAVNRSITKYYKQRHVIQQPANLSHICESIKRYGNNLPKKHRRVLLKASFLFYHLAYDMHIFTDGNKRTAVFSLYLFLFLNGVVLETKKNQQTVEKLVLDTAKGNCSISKIQKYLSKNSRKFGIGEILILLIISITSSITANISTSVKRLFP